MNIFRSIRFNIFLGVSIASACALGTFLPQIPETPEKAARLSIGGWSSRGSREFEKEFARLMGSLRDNLGSCDFKLSKNPLVEVS